MRLAIKLLIVATVLHGTFRVGEAYWQHYAFEDAVRSLTQFSDRASADDIASHILSLAEEREIPLDPEQLSVEREQRRIIVDASYVRDVELLPRYRRPWTFTLHVTVFTL